MIKRLSPREFARAMKLGLGRTLLHVAEYGDEGVEEIIKEAMLKSLAYDVQVEGLRSWWLRDIVMLTGRVRHYGRFLYENFNSGELETNDIGQQYNLAAIFFDLGMHEFGPLLFSDIKRFQSHWPGQNCGFSLVIVAGKTGLEAIARLCDKFPEQFDEYVCHTILEKSFEDGSAYEIREQLQQLAETDAGVRMFLENSAAHKESMESLMSSASSTEMTFDIFRELVEKGDQGRFGGKSRAFGRGASAEDLIRVLDLFEQTKDPRKKRECLQVFSLRDVPEVRESIIEVFRGSNKELRRAAAQVLSRIQSEQIRSLALDFISSGNFEKVNLGMEMLEGNYLAKDVELIAPVVMRLRDPEQIHLIGMEVRSIATKYGGPELADLLVWLFWSNPESFCRRSFFNLLVEMNLCPEDVAREAQWDSGTELKDAARAYCADKDQVRVRVGLVEEEARKLEQ